MAAAAAAAAAAAGASSVVLPDVVRRRRAARARAVARYHDSITHGRSPASFSRMGEIWEHVNASNVRAGRMRGGGALRGVADDAEIAADTEDRRLAAASRGGNGARRVRRHRSPPAAAAAGVGATAGTTRDAALVETRARARRAMSNAGSEESPGGGGTGEHGEGGSDGEHRAGTSSPSHEGDALYESESSASTTEEAAAPVHIRVVPAGLEAREKSIRRKMSIIRGAKHKQGVAAAAMKRSVVSALSLTPGVGPGTPTIGAAAAAAAEAPDAASGGAGVEVDGLGQSAWQLHQKLLDRIAQTRHLNSITAGTAKAAARFHPSSDANVYYGTTIALQVCA